MYIGGPKRESKSNSVMMSELLVVIHDKASNSWIIRLVGIFCQVWGRSQQPQCCSMVHRKGGGMWGYVMGGEGRVEDVFGEGALILLLDPWFS